MTDVLKDKEFEVKLYDGKGGVRLLDCMPRLLDAGKKTADYAIAAMARVSYGNLDSKSDLEDSRLVSYLVENYHTSPLEGIKFKFLITCPIYVERQLIRHRTAQVNEYSMRYSEAIDDFHFPAPRAQDKTNKQQSIEAKFDKETEDSYRKACTDAAGMINTYRALIKGGVAREVTRSILCTAEMTKLIWCMDAHNLFKFLKLRCDRAHAQKEIADLADGILTLIRPIIPNTCAAFEKFWLKSVSITQEELSVIKSEIDPEIFKKNINQSTFTTRQKKDLLAKLGLN